MSGRIVLPTLRAANAARQREWKGSLAIGQAYRANELAGEAGEACNVIKKLERARLGVAGSRARADMLGAELADVVICADLIAMALDRDLPPFRPLEQPISWTAANMGACLADFAGKVCAAVNGRELHAAIADECGMVVAQARAIAQHYGIDLDLWIARKFNETSAKVGLSVFLASHHEPAPPSEGHEGLETQERNPASEGGTEGSVSPAHRMSGAPAAPPPERDSVCAKPGHSHRAGEKLAGPYAYLVAIPGLGEDDCILQDDPLDEDRKRDGWVAFPLFMTPEDDAQFWAMMPPALSARAAAQDRGESPPPPSPPPHKGEGESGGADG